MAGMLPSRPIERTQAGGATRTKIPNRLPLASLRQLVLHPRPGQPVTLERWPERFTSPKQRELCLGA